MSTFHWDVTLLCTFLYAAPFLWVTSSQFRVFCEGQKMRPKIPEVLQHRGTPNMNFFSVYLGFRAVRKKSTGIESWVGHTSCMTWNEIWICHMYQKIRFSQSCKVVAPTSLARYRPSCLRIAPACVGSLLPLGTASQLSAVTVHRRSQTHFGCGSHSENPQLFYRTAATSGRKDGWPMLRFFRIKLWKWLNSEVVFVFFLPLNSMATGNV